MSVCVIDPGGFPSTLPTEPARSLSKFIRSFGFGFDPGLRIIPSLKVSSLNLVASNAKAGAFCVAGGLLGGFGTLFTGGLRGLGRGGCGRGG